MRDASEVIAACPFCGGDVNLQGAPDCGYFIACENEACCMANRAAWDAHALIASWNRRPAAEPADAGRDAVVVARVIHSADALTRMELLPEGLLLGYGTHDLYTRPPSEAAAVDDAMVERALQAYHATPVHPGRWPHMFSNPLTVREMQASMRAALEAALASQQAVKP